LIGAHARSRGLPGIALVLVAVMALAFSLVLNVRPVLAEHVTGGTVQLHQDLGDGVSGGDPGEFAGSDEECANLEEGQTLFHFVANHLADGTAATQSTLTADFSDRADETVTGYYPSGSPQPTVHFDVVIEGDGNLVNAWADFNVDQTEDAMLLLSHICGGGEVQVEADLTLIKQSEEGGAFAGVGFTLVGVSGEQLTDASGQIVFENIPEGGWTLRETSNPDEDCGINGSVTVAVHPDGHITVHDDDLADGLAIVSFDATTNTLTLTNDCADDVVQGTVEIEKFFCPTDGETRTEIDVFGPGEPMDGFQSQQAPETDCSVGAGVTFTVWAGDMLVTTVTTDADGIVEFTLDPGDYLIREEASGASEPFSVAGGQVTAIVVSNFVAEQAGEGQLKVLKYFCDVENEEPVEFFHEGQAPNLENCDPADAEFSVDGGAAFSTSGGIAVVNLPEGEGYVLAEVGTGASTEFDIVAGEITSIIVLNFPQAEVEADLTLIKQAEDGSTFAGVGFTLVDLTDEQLTDASGQTLFEDIPLGDWTLRETSNPDEDCGINGSVTVVVHPDGHVTVHDDDLADGLIIVSFDAETNTLVLSNDCEDEVEADQGTVEVEKFFCDTEGETRTEIDVFGPAEPMDGFESQQAPETDCTVGAGITFTIWQGDTEVTSVTTDADGIAEFMLDPGDYVIEEDMSGATAEFSVAANQVTAIVVVNYVAVAGEETGQLKVLKYFCDVENENLVEFFPEGDAPDLEDCDPADAEFTIDGGAAFSTEGGIAVRVLPEGEGYVLAEVSTGASTEFDIVAGEITSIIVLNFVESGVSPGENGNGGAPGGEQGVQPGQGGPGMLPDTAAQPFGGAPIAVLAVVLMAGLGGLGAWNLVSVRRRMG
jgi:hypothetical protein